MNPAAFVFYIRFVDSDFIRILAFTMNNWKKVFAIIWTGQFFSILTSSIVNFAIVLWLSFETKSAEVLALATIMAMLPQSVFLWIGGKENGL